MKNKQKNFFSSSRAHELPELEKFKKLSFISLEPNQIETKNYTKKTENSHTKENYLNENCGYYINKFNKVSLAIIGEKFEKINKEIDYILNTLKNEKSYETFFHSLILNTDQNEDIFFDQLEKYFTNKQGYRIEKLFDYSFNEIKNLFKNLYNDNCSEDNSIKDVEMDNSYCAKKNLPKLVLLRNIQKIDSFNLNLYIDKLIEYSNAKYVIIFDVGYDPRCLFEKVNTKNLTRMILHKLDYVSSKNIYKEILYKFIHEENNLFVPDSKNLNQIVDFVNNNQISVKAFMKYFQFLIIYFFILKKWETDHYLIFLKVLKKSDFKTNVLFKNILTEMKSSKNEKINEKVEDLNNVYLNFKNIKKIFFGNYKFLEEILMKVNKNFNKYDFFFDFLQLGDRGVTKDREKNRIESLFNNLTKTDLKWRELIETIILPTFEKMYNDTKNLLFENEEQQIMFYNSNVKKLNDILNSKGIQDEDFFQGKQRNRMQKILETGGNKLQTEEEKSELFNLLKTENNYQKDLTAWFEGYMRNDVFLFPANYILFHKKQTQLSLAGYLNFREMTNPSLSFTIMNQLQNMNHTLFTLYSLTCKKEKNEAYSRFSYLKTFQGFLYVFSTLGLEFKIKSFFYEFLRNEVPINEEFEDNKIIQTYSNIFLKFCHEFFVMGFIAKKNQKSDIFIKNYFKITTFFINRGEALSNEVIKNEVNSVNI